MFLVASLVPFFVLASTVAAHPAVVRDSLISLPIARHFNGSRTLDLARADRERAKSFVEYCNDTFASESGVDIGVTHNITMYTTSVGVGDPPTYYNLAVDTGSSNTWVGAITPYVMTNTSVQTSNNVSVRYGTGNFSGIEYTDTVTIAPGITVLNQSIGVASNSTGFADSGLDGILGLGPANLTLTTLRPDSNTSIPTVVDNLFSDRTIPSNLFSVSFEPTTSQLVKNGELTFGGVDTTKYYEPIIYVPITTSSPADRYWGVNQTIQYGDSTPILDNGAGIIDTGTTLISLTTDAYDRYVNATGAVLDSDVGLLRITNAQFSNLESLFFTIGEGTFELTPNAQIWPRSLYDSISGKQDSVYLIINDLGNKTGFQFINGIPFFERFYTVFDADNHRIGFANTSFTTANVN